MEWHLVQSAKLNFKVKETQYKKPTPPTQPKEEKPGFDIGKILNFTIYVMLFGMMFSMLLPPKREEKK